MELIQHQYEQLSMQMEEQFEQKIQQINKRYHVIETQLKNKIKQLEKSNGIKKDDSDSIKYKAKISSLEKQIQLLQNKDFPSRIQEMPQQPTPISLIDEVLQSLKKQFKIQNICLHLYPQIDTLIPNLIEILPLEINVFSDFTLILYKFNYYEQFKSDPFNSKLQLARKQNKSSEQQVNDVMFAAGCAQDFEISFTPQQAVWRKITKLSDNDIQLPKNALKLTQSLKVQEQIIKIISKQLKDSYIQIDRNSVIQDNSPLRNKQQNINTLVCRKQLRERQILLERLNLSIQLLILGLRKEDIILAFQNLIDDLQINNYQLQQYQCKELKSREIENLIYLRLLDYKTDLEIIHTFLDLMLQYKRNLLSLQLSFNYLVIIIIVQFLLQMNFMMIGLIRNIKVYQCDNNINYNDIYMIKPFVENHYQQPEQNQSTLKKYPIYRKQAKIKEQPQPPKRMPVRELFNYLNIWNCKTEKKYDYLSKFQKYLENKRETIEMAEIEKEMKQPDFIKFFKYLKDNPKKQSNQNFEDEDPIVQLDIAYTAKQRRENNKTLQLTKKMVLPPTLEQPHHYPIGFNPNIEIPQPSPDDFIIVTHFYKSSLEHQQQESVPKSVILNYLLDNKKIMQAYKINKTLVEVQLMEFPSHQEDFITLEEFINFMLYPKILIVKDKSPEINLPKIVGQNIFDQEDIQKLKYRYDEDNVDKTDQVNILKLISAYRTQFEFQQLLFKPFIKFPKCDKICTFEKWLYEFYNFCQLSDITTINFTKLQELFIQLFQIPNKFVILKSVQMSKIQQFNKLQENDKLSLSSHFYSNLEKIFNSIQKVDERHVNRDVLIDTIQCDDHFMKTYLKLKVRQQNTNQLPIETVEQTLNRMKTECEEYLDLDELIDFFTVRGRPINLSHKLKKQYNQSNKLEQQQQQLNTFGAINKIGGNYLITIPDNLIEEKYEGKSIRQKAVEQQLINKEKDIVKNINQKFKAQKVPWYVTEPLYDQFNREREEARQKLKDESKARLMESMMAPKSFEKLPKRIEMEEEIEFKYKSRPIPNSTLNNLYDQMVFEQKIRSKSNVARRKHEWDEYFTNSTQLQDTQIREEQQRLRKRTKNPLSYQAPKSQRFRAKSLPNFERLHAQFENELLTKRKIFEPTIPYSTTLTTQYSTTTDVRALDIKNVQKIQAQQRLIDIDSRLKKILESEPPNIPKTKQSRSIPTLRRKQKFEKLEKIRKQENEVKAMKEERQKLLPEGINVTNPAAKQQKLLDEELNELVKWKKNYHKNLDLDYEKQLLKMQKKIKKRPLLMYKTDELQQDEDEDDESSKDSSNKNKSISEDYKLF